MHLFGADLHFGSVVLFLSTLPSFKNVIQNSAGAFSHFGSMWVFPHYLQNIHVYSFGQKCLPNIYYNTKQQASHEQVSHSLSVEILKTTELLTFFLFDFLPQNHTCYRTVSQNGKRFKLKPNSICIS